MSFLSRLLPSASLQLPYLTSTSPSNLDDSLAQLAKACGSVVQAVQAGEHIPQAESSVVQIVKVEGKAVVEEEKDADIQWEGELLSFLPSVLFPPSSSSFPSDSALPRS